MRLATCSFGLGCGVEVLRSATSSLSPGGCRSCAASAEIRLIGTARTVSEAHSTALSSATGCAALTGMLQLYSRGVALAVSARAVPRHCSAASPPPAPFARSLRAPDLQSTRLPGYSCSRRQACAIPLLKSLRARAVDCTPRSGRLEHPQQARRRGNRDARTADAWPRPLVSSPLLPRRHRDNSGMRA